MKAQEEKADEFSYPPFLIAFTRNELTVFFTGMADAACCYYRIGRVTHDYEEDNGFSDDLQHIRVSDLTEEECAILKKRC